MQGTFCIDKRIGYLALFAVPLMVLTIFSLMVNSQKVSQSSRAEGLAPTSFIKISPTTTLTSNTCFKFDRNQINPNQIDGPLIRIYGWSSGVFSYLTYFQTPFYEKLLATVQRDNNKPFLYGVQGEMTTDEVLQKLETCNPR